MNRSGKLPIIVLAAVVALALVGTGAFLFIGKGSGDKHAKAPEKEVLVPLEEFVLNLADVNQAHYLKLEASLGIADTGKSGGGHGKGGPLDESLPIIRDTIITVTGRHTYDDLLSTQGKEDLKKQIKAALEKELPDAHIKNVYFTNFAMQ